MKTKKDGGPPVAPDLSGALGLPPVADLDPLFSPASVALIGATERPGSVGAALTTNLSRPAPGRKVFFVNSKRRHVAGQPAVASIADVPGPVDLAVIVTPASTVPDVLEECVRAGVKSAVVISAGFKEAGAEGAALEARLGAIARESGRNSASGAPGAASSANGIRIIGPNCLGVMNPWTGLNATFASAMALKGRLAFLSQSGALCTAILDWSLREQVGFSLFVSLGSMVDVGWHDLLEYLSQDPKTESILLYMESIRDARAFVSAARSVAWKKPVLVIKAGRTPQAAQAARSHTGALTGNDEVWDAAFRRCGALRVDRIGELFHMAEVLAKQPRPKGPRLTVVTNAGGPGVLAADALVRAGGALAPIPPEIRARLSEKLPPHWSQGNPIDVIGDADPERYVHAVETAASNPESDGLLIVLSPQAMTDPTVTARRLVETLPRQAGPVLVSWMGGESVAEGEREFIRAGVPAFAYPDEAAATFHLMWRHTEALRALYERPTLLTGVNEVHPIRERTTEVIRSVRAARRTLLTEAEAKQALAGYGLAVVEGRIAGDADAAVQAAESLGYPVVLKLHSLTLTHKSDVGGVKLNLQDAAAVKRAFVDIADQVGRRAGPGHFQGVNVQRMAPQDGMEWIVGSRCDEQFGPVLLVGAGGKWTEAYRDVALELPPLNTSLARQMLHRTRLAGAMTGPRGVSPARVEEFEQWLVRFSQFIVEHREIREIDINPLQVSSEGLLILDARIVLHDETGAPPASPAIRPYPDQYVWPWKRNGTDAVVRPIRPEDEPLMVAFHRALSDHSVHMRYFTHMSFEQRVAHERLVRVCWIDYDRRITLVVDQRDPGKGSHELIAVGQVLKTRQAGTAEVAVIVKDGHQARGVGRELLNRLMEVGRSEGYDRLTAEVRRDNLTMLKLLERAGFEMTANPDDQSTCTASRSLPRVMMPAA